MNAWPPPVWRNTVYLLYDLILLAAVLVVVPYYVVQGLRQGQLSLGLRQRLGCYSEEQLAGIRDRKVLWVHAASVGEIRAVIPLLRGLKEQYPNHALALSTVTETGQVIARQLPQVDSALLFPYDLSYVVGRALKAIRPALIVIIETEIWPNLLRAAQRQRIPVVLVNGRISDRSFPRYCRAKFLLRGILSHFQAFCMQTSLDAERIRHLGAPAERVTVTGNVKFDMKTVELDNARLRDDFCIPADCPVWIAGSTHEGEEEVVLEVYRRLLAEGQKLVLILVPRHPQRCRTVADKFARQGWPITMRSTIAHRDRPLRSGDVLLVDSVGELLKFYAVAEVIFVGGSLVGVGGHNVLEGALLKKPVLFGPHMQNFKDIAQMLLNAGGGRCVSNQEELLGAVRELLQNELLRETMGQNGYASLEKNRGASEQTLAIVDQAMKTHAATCPSAP
jgi:3-deoxy-D-manno-octulosonic-acid transferase